MPLDRNSAAREKPQWMESQLRSHNRLAAVVCGDQNLVMGDPSGATLKNLVVSGDHASSILENCADVHYLGHSGNQPVFAADLTDLGPSDLQAVMVSLGPTADFHDLRKIGLHLEGQNVAIQAYARGLCYWHRQNRFCSRCGQTLKIFHGGHMKKCIDSNCGRMAFPHTNPAVIMAVSLRSPGDGIPKCLLGRHGGLPAGMYSTLAGFVDIGESLEEAVAREVLEEAGVKVTDVRYAGSQPWPFPSALMMGFHAETDQETLTVDYEEMEDARWFSVEELESFGDYAESDGMTLPRKDSIARNLIDTWISMNRQ
jgi:NAD+ diphosphatase